MVKWITAAVLAALAGLWVSSVTRERQHDRDAAARLFAEFEGQRNRTLIELRDSNRGVRQAFFELWLREPVENSEQGLVVALSQVRTAEAMALFQDAILPKFETAANPKTLRECLLFMHRWNIAQAMDEAAREKLAAKLTDAIVKAQDTDQAESLGDALQLLAPELGPENAETLLAKLVPAVNGDYSRLRGVGPLAERLAPGKADPLVEKLADSPPAVLAIALQGLGPKLSQPAADALASKIAARIASEGNSVAMGSLAACLSAMKDRISGPKASELARPIVQRLIVEFNAEARGALLSSWQALGPKIDASAAKELGATLTKGMMINSDPHALHSLASAIAVLKIKPKTNLIARMNATTDPGALAELSSAIAALDNDEDTAAAAGLLVRRMLSERDVTAIGVLGSSLDELDEGLDAKNAGQLAAQFAARMSAERDPTTLMNLAIGFIAVAERTGDDQADALAKPLLARMRDETRPGALRTLAFSLGTLGEYPEAVALVRKALAIETNPEKAHNLRTGLYALRQDPGEEQQKSEPPKPDEALRQVLDPTLSRDPWLLAAAVVLKQKLPEAELPGDFQHLVSDDDDAGDSSDNTGIEIDFNKLSGAIAPGRPAAKSWF